MSPYGAPPPSTSTIRRVVLSFHYSHPLPLPAPAPHPRDSEKCQKSGIVLYCLNEPKMTSVHHCLFLPCRLRLSSLKARRSQTQISTYLIVFKTSQTSRFLESACFAHLRYLTRHLLTVDKMEPRGYETPSCLSEFSDPETPRGTDE